jgi:ABC-type antimicrobial peptide transport system permease subunit
MFPVGEQKETFTIAGVVRDIPSLRPGTPASPQLYWSNRQAPRPFTYFLVRTTVPPASIAPAVRARLSAVNKDFEPRGFETMEELVARNVRSPRFNMTLILALGLVALVLAGIGTYGLLAYYVEQRHREIGIRLALGARRETVVAAIMSNGLKLALAGVSAGVVGALLLARVIGTFVWGVSPYDPVTLAGSALVVVTIAAAACLIPAWRASRVDPAVTLATE